ncbi:nucleotide disphospho-sugar-binding domain-containing protein [Piscinibacter sakaiensis]|uniref:glycosyltransferase n=1 Tax=Piscinibacter sakaiensis TaxID=1547922 RepID=UPI00372BB994
MAADILILTFGSLGDVLPLAALGGRLVRRGHRVRLWCGELHRPMVARLGVEALALEPSPLPALAVQASPVKQSPQMWRRVEEGLQAGYAAIAAEADAAARTPGRAPPVLVASSFALAGRLAQERLGLPLATVHLSPMCLASFLDPPPIGDLVVPGWMPRPLRPLLGRTMERWLFDPVTARALNALRRDLGLPPVRHVLSRWLHSPQAVLGLFPDWFGWPQPDWPAATRLLDFPLADACDDPVLAAPDPALEAFLAAGAPPVVFYPGSARRQAGPFFDEALRACERDYVPLGPLLRRSAALVHCGGIGTLAQGLAAGCPQLLLPYTFDHFDNARRLRAG